MYKRQLYQRYETEGRGNKKIKARELMVKIIESMIETGGPYMLAKDAANLKSNQKNIGTIKSSNLCTEIMEVSDFKDEIATCNLASVCLNKFVVDGKYDFAELHRVVKIMTKNLNRVIDKTFYPLDKAKKSNSRHRPIGLGVQGLADVFFLLNLPFDGAVARKLNRDIFETIYHAFIEQSLELAKQDGAYETFKGSPASEGQLQFDLWGVIPETYSDWDKLKSEVRQYGIRNSLGVAPMPTASTASVYGNYEAFHPQSSCLGKREVLSGEFVVVNQHLTKDLEALDLWTKDIRDKIIANNGSVQTIPEIPQTVKDVYKTVWELSQKVLIDLAADRGPYVCQSQSMNLWLANPTVAQVNSALFYGRSKGLKTLSYYLYSKPSMMAQKVTTATVPAMTAEEQLSCSLDSPEDCVACSS